jgi:hypothetical protein
MGFHGLLRGYLYSTFTLPWTISHQFETSRYKPSGGVYPMTSFSPTLLWGLLGLKQKWLATVFLVINRDRHERLTYSPPSVIRLKNAVFWGVTLCSACKNRRFGGT